MDDLPDLPARRGRGARSNPENEYEPLQVDLDPDQLTDDELRQVDTTYYKDPAQSILSKNQSPDVPFTYSINPYRGCEHGCVYCLAGDTQILMGNGSTTPLQAIEQGDVVYGTQQHGAGRRLTRTRVHDQWQTHRPAYRIVLANGTSLIAGPNHRFLTPQGWTFVTDSGPGEPPRRSLDTGVHLLGVAEPNPSPSAASSATAPNEAGSSPSSPVAAPPSASPSSSTFPPPHIVTTEPGRAVSYIEPLSSQQPLYDLTTGTGDFIANGIVSHNCYARPTHEYLGFSAGLDFETQILVKTNAPERLEEGLQQKNWSPAPICLSGNTDPYQPAEHDLEITRRLLVVCNRHRNPVRLITKSGMVTRDLDILDQMAEWDGIHVTVSLTTLDDELAGAMEPRAARPPLRLRAIQECAEADIPVNVNVAPIVPGLTDEEVPRILEAAAERGAASAGYTVLRLPGAVREVFVDWLERHAPERKNRVLRRLRSLRGEDLNDTDFGVRMTGEGLWAETIDDLFQLAVQKHGLDNTLPPLNTDAFRRRPGGQIGMFE